MSKNQALLDYLTSRRSVTLPFLVEPGPSPEEMDTLLQIATRVPDHGKIAPWRIVVIAGDARKKAGEALAEIAARNNPQISKEQLDVETKQFLPAPLTLMVVSSPQLHPKVPAFEQLLSGGCVAFNVVHGAFALGYAAHWVTRWFAFDESSKALFGVSANEQIVGFVHVGTPETKLEERDRPALNDVVSYWDAP